jgi:hypothetical protein
MIIFFYNKINNFNENNFKNLSSHTDINSYIQSFMPDLSNLHKNVCPYCGAKNKLIRYGKYERNISFLVDNHVENYKVKVQRVFCNSCNHTNALLPNFVVPYKIMAICSIAQIVQRASISSAYKLAEIINLSFQMIYTYIAIVLAFFNDFRILNNSKEHCYTQNFNQKYFLTNCIDLSNSKCRLDFFEFYNWFLFMQKFRNNSSPPIIISISKMPPT